MLRFGRHNVHVPHHSQRVKPRLRRLPPNVQAAPSTRADCSCDPRFVGVAHDIDCPIHGLATTARSGS